VPLGFLVIVSLLACKRSLVRNLAWPICVLSIPKPSLRRLTIGAQVANLPHTPS
jgi:hypothetical protein